MKNPSARSIALLLAVMVHPSVTNCQATAPARFPYTLAIKSVSQTAKPGSKVVIDVAFTNATDAAVPSPPMEIESMRFGVDISQAGAGPATLSDRGREWHHKGGGWSGSGPFFLVEPGKTVHSEIVVSDLYDMTSPGKYSIQLHRDDVSSNTITVEIVP